MGSDTYCINDDLVLDNGDTLDQFLLRTLTNTQKDERKARARQKAFNFINDNHLLGRTRLPAMHIPSLREIERDLAISFMMGASFSGEETNVSDWVNDYRDRAKDALKNLRWSATYTEPVANSENTGNGTIEIHAVFDHVTRTENWILRASGATYFSVYGSQSKWMPTIEVGVRYPEKDWDFGTTDYGVSLKNDKVWNEFPFHLTITGGATDFAQDDIFVFKTFSANPAPKHAKVIKLA